MIILWTDALIFLLCLILVGFVVYLRHQVHFERPLKKIAHHQPAMVSLVILVFFVIIGLLDSMHFKSSDSKQDVISVLDYSLHTVKVNSEKTYSAPFATHLYNKEMRVEEGGKMQWDYPRLVFGGRHLQAPEKGYVDDIAFKALLGCLKGGAIFMLSIIAYAFLLSRSVYVNNPVTLTFLILCLLSGSLLELAQYYHVFGTDKVGEDVFYQSLKSVRTGLVIGTLTTLVMLPFAIVLGVFAGFYQGWVDDLIQYFYTTLNAIPSVLLIAAAALMVQVYMTNHESEFTSMVVRADMRLLFLCVILGMTSWTGLCRVLRAETLKLREMPYVQAAYALGVKQHTILLRHILPNVMHLVICSLVLDFSSLVLAEAVLSYINIGVDPASYSWGNMINGARLEIAREPIVWWSLSAAFIFMFSLVLSANLFADTVQDAFDPRTIK